MNPELPVDLSGAQLGSHLRGADLRSDHLVWLDLRGSQIDAGTQLPAKHRLAWDILHREQVRRPLRDTDLSLSILEGAELSQADLRGARLENTLLRDARLMRAILSNAGLVDANLQRANLTSAVLARAKLAGADLRGALGLTCALLERAADWAFSYRSPDLACGASVPTPAGRPAK